MIVPMDKKIPRFLWLHDLQKLCFKASCSQLWWEVTNGLSLLFKPACWDWKRVYSVKEMR